MIYRPNRQNKNKNKKTQGNRISNQHYQNTCLIHITEHLTQQQQNKHPFQTPFITLMIYLTTKVFSEEFLIVEITQTISHSYDATKLNIKNKRMVKLKSIH